jgi:sensor c-di-GMP phosphodiesterase-like protein
MAKLISILISRSQQRLLGFLIWGCAFVLTLVAAGTLAAFQINQTMIAEGRAAMEPHVRVRENIASTVKEMQRSLTATPCSAEFHDQLRVISFLPDGINEFLYAPGGIATCSVNADFPAHDLGTPDIHSDEPDVSLWYDKSLDFTGRTGLRGNIVRYGDFALVVPGVADPVIDTPWLQYQVVAVSPTGQYWHRNGSPEVYQTALGAGPLGALLPMTNGSFYSMHCTSDGGTCAALTGRLADIVYSGLPSIALAVAVSAIVALGLGGQVHNLLRRHWSFEARFRRRFSADTVICTYQPILCLETDEITGCEVLMRWRDVDGSIVFPDQFLPVVAKHGLGRELTRYVVDCAYRELSTAVPAHIKLQVNINIFPADLDSEWLREVLAAFKAAGDRFNVVVEIVESDELDIHTAQREIEALRGQGIATYLDDFGTGYSNIQNLASLALAGVKLDRSFAMSPDGSLMNKMLVNAIELIHSAGHRLTVEGVETEDRLQMLKSTGLVHFAQGYLISRPLDIDRFVQFLGEERVFVAKPHRLVA